jgi:tetratricopeptide (TPR) repeat protein
MFTFNSFAQKEKTSSIGEKMKTTQKQPDTVSEVKSSRLKAIKSYYVEENINMKFGGYTTTYEVLELRLINTYDLGPNNTRIIIPRYREINKLNFNQIEANKNLIFKKIMEPIKNSIKIPQFKEELPTQNQLDTITELIKVLNNEEVNNSKKSKKYIYIHLIKTYERIAEKGCKSIEIFQKIGDASFFDGSYAKAAKWYGELFKMTTNLDSDYYDRYVYTLKSIGEKDKAKEIKEKRNQLFGIN